MIAKLNYESRFILLEQERLQRARRQSGRRSSLSANTAALCILLSRRINDTIHHDDKLGFVASLKRKGRKGFRKNWREKNCSGIPQVGPVSQVEGWGSCSLREKSVLFLLATCL